MTKRKIVLIITFLFILIFVYLIVRRQTAIEEPVTSPTPDSQTENPIELIEPGVTNEIKMREILGVPNKTEQTEGGALFYYDSPIINYDNRLLVNNGEVKLIKEQLDVSKPLLKIHDFLPNPSSEPTQKYSATYGDAIAVYLYPQDGMAFVAHTFDQSVYEIWRFEPTSIIEILNTWGSNLIDEEDLHIHGE